MGYLDEQIANSEIYQGDYQAQADQQRAAAYGSIATEAEHGHARGHLDQANGYQHLADQQANYQHNMRNA